MGRTPDRGGGLPPAAAGLPVVAALADLARALARHRAAVLVAPTGSGKSTVVPLAPLAAGWGKDWLGRGTILMAEPRRIAARATARRMADLLGERVGDRIGYRVRFDTRVGPGTRVEVVTEGVLVRRLQQDPALEGVGLVVLDEFHERNVETDLCLALLLDARAALREDLRVLVMSATLDPGPVGRLLGGAPAIRAGGGSHPVDVVHLGAPPRGEIGAAVTRAVARALDETGGDVLAFLPGAREIGDVCARLERMHDGRDTVVCPLHGDLPAAAQDRAIRADEGGRRRVVVATNVAESSLTIEGVTAVVDAGLARVPRFDPASGLTRLETVRVSRAEAGQRAGRAGRTAPGRCYRLWSEEEHARLARAPVAAIREADLAALVLETAAWGSPDPRTLAWLDPPPEAALAQARDLLRSLGAVDDRGLATARGRRMAEVAAHPRLAAMLEAAAGDAETALACDLAALLEARDPLTRGRGPGAARPPAGAAVHERLQALAAGAGGFGAIARASRALRGARGVRASVAAGTGAGRLLCTAYPDRVAQRRGAAGERTRYRLANGRGVRLPEGDPLGRAQYLVVANLDARGADARARLACEVSRDDVEAVLGSRVESRDRVRFDPREECVTAVRERRLGAIVLDSAPAREPDPEAVRAAMLDGVRRMGLAVLPWTASAQSLRDRTAALRRWRPRDGWPDLGDDALLETVGEWLAPWLAGITRRAHLARIDLAAALKSWIGAARLADLERLAPTHVRLRGGRRAKLDYAVEDPPVLALRVQDFYGEPVSPSVCDGARPVTLRLLSPAGRPVQITRDLAGFWAGTWSDVRKEMRARYPKHDWPEDPAAAAPPPRPSRRRGQTKRGLTP